MIDARYFFSKDFLKKVLNFGVYYIGWIVTVLAAAHNTQYLGIAAATGLLLINSYVCRPSTAELKLIAILVFIGFWIDTALIYFGIVSFTSPNPIAHWAAPLWILMLYILFAISLCHSLSWADHYFWLLIPGGASGGVISYFYGAKMGAMCFTIPFWKGLLLIGCIWAVFMPLMFLLKEKLIKPTK